MGDGDPASEVRGRVLLLGVALAGLAYAAAGGLKFAEGTDPHAPRMALAVTVFVATAWLARAMPLGAASLLPLVLMPLLGVQSMGGVARSYAHPILWLFFGGFVLALAIEKWGLHRRLALKVISGIGMRPRRLVLGFMMAGLVLSMWISNTATSLMLLPIGWALVERVQEQEVLSAADGKRLGVALMLGIAYGCSIGGTATPIGTAPNLLFFREYADAGGPALSFLVWVLAFLPFALCLALVVWCMLVFVLHRLPAGTRDAGASVRAEVEAQPAMSSAEKRVLGLFVLAAGLWVTRGDLRLGDDWTIRGWASWLHYPADFVPDGVVAVGVAILSFLVPSAGPGSPRIMDWETVGRVRWDILFLLGAGVSIASSFRDTGLCDALGELAAPAIGDLSPVLAILATALFVTFLTEVTSNTAITALMLPVLLATAASAGMDPLILMLPATLAASCAFMLPIATPPNAVVFSSGKVSFGEMARTGFLLNLLSVLLITAALWFWVLPLLGGQTQGVPEWVK